jgi:hypothetical protein
MFNTRSALVVALYVASYVTYSYEFALFSYFNSPLWVIGIAWGLMFTTAALVKFYLHYYNVRTVVLYQTACFCMMWATILRHWKDDANMMISMILQGVVVGAIPKFKISPQQLILAVVLGGCTADMGVLFGGEEELGFNYMYWNGVFVPQDIAFLLSCLLFVLAPFDIGPEDMIDSGWSALPQKTIPVVEREGTALFTIRVTAFRLLQNLALIAFPAFEEALHCTSGYGLLIIFMTLSRVFGQYCMEQEHVDTVRFVGWFSALLMMPVLAKPETVPLGVLAGLSQMAMCTAFIRPRERLPTQKQDLLAGVLTLVIFLFVPNMSVIVGFSALCFALTYKYKEHSN